MHTIERFKSFNDAIEIITVLPENQLRYWIDLQKKHSFSIPHTLVKEDQTVSSMSGTDLNLLIVRGWQPFMTE